MVLLGSPLSLSGEELALLAAAHDVTTLPGLGPVEDALIDAAATSLRARGLGDIGVAGDFVPVPRLEPLFVPFLAPELVVTAARWNARERGSRAWTGRRQRITEVAQLAPGAYELTGLAPAGLRERFAAFLELHGDDVREEQPQGADALPEPAWVAEATLTGRGREPVALQWVDPGDASYVWVLGDGDPVTAARTGRAALLDRLGSAADPRR